MAARCMDICVTGQIGERRRPGRTRSFCRRIRRMPPWLDTCGRLAPHERADERSDERDLRPPAHHVITASMAHRLGVCTVLAVFGGFGFGCSKSFSGPEE